MAIHLSGVFFNKSSISSPVFQHQRRPPLTVFAAASASASAAHPPSSPPTIQIVGGKSASWYGNGDMNSSNAVDCFKDGYDWADLENDLYHWTKTLRPVQWYPGHIAKTERELKEQLKLMDVVIEMDSWLGNRKRILVLNREDMISTADRNAWADYYGRQGIKVVFSNGKLGMGAMKLGRLAKSVAAERRMCPAAPRPGVTRSLKWVRFGSDLELLDSPGIIPMRMSDQTAAIKLAICDDIGEKSYDVTDVAAVLVQMLSKLPAANNNVLWERYKIDTDGRCGKT
ncbi:GTP-binding protein, orthogonal bundle domain-containing protein [Cynara cardunculus var. scolymus]|uniref:GTP-binding protein, orthogonal bundle domain-containing protein n=1 Tax=Cynara cardunculus var. scolymus TaxID=59895 RepID=A0A118K7P3_CYNCS|nr:GTP-binding protein, orthogonal bundle domain-containing protein [Cynara cardunculus var. scolymus]